MMFRRSSPSLCSSRNPLTGLRTGFSSCGDQIRESWPFDYTQDRLSLERNFGRAKDYPSSTICLSIFLEIASLLSVTGNDSYFYFVNPSGDLFSKAIRDGINSSLLVFGFAQPNRQPPPTKYCHCETTVAISCYLECFSKD